VIVIFLSVWYCCPSPDELYNEISVSKKIYIIQSDTLKICIIQSDTLIKVSLEKAMIQRQTLLSILQIRESTKHSEYTSHESGLTQTRSIYFGILAILLSFVISKDSKNKISILSTLLGLTIIMYLLDVHMKDLMKREYDSTQLGTNEIHNLLNKNPNDSTWYILSFDNYDKTLGMASKWPERWYRKFVSACYPDGVQIVYFYIPFILFYIVLVYEISRKSTSHAQKKI
jgi:hypothetical protein